MKRSTELKRWAVSKSALTNNEEAEPSGGFNRRSQRSTHPDRRTPPDMHAVQHEVLEAPVRSRQGYRKR